MGIDPGYEKGKGKRIRFDPVGEGKGVHPAPPVGWRWWWSCTRSRRGVMPYPWGSDLPDL